jgi:hypothetical protein
VSFFFDVSKYTQVPQPGGWDALNSALNAIREKRLREDLQAQAEAHNARQNELQRGALLQSQITEEGNRRFAVGEQNRRADAQGAATAAEKAMLAEQAGQYGAADAIVAGAAPTGLRSAMGGPVTGAPEAPPTNLRMPEMRADRTPQVAPQMVMGAQLRQPMTGPPGTQSALWDAIQRERGQLSLGDQGRQIGAMGQDVNALTPQAPPELQQVRDRVFSQGGNVLGRTNREDNMRQLIAKARALAAPGALSSNPLAANERAEMMGTRTGEVSDRIRDKTLYASAERTIVASRTEDVRDATNKLQQIVEGARAGNPAAMGAIPIAVARVIQGTGQVSNADANAMEGTRFYNYATSVQDWIERRVASDPSWTPDSDPSGAPPVSVEFLASFADDIARFKSLQMARLYKAQMKFVMSQPYADEGYRDGLVELVNARYAGLVTDEDIALSDAADAAYQRGKRGRRRSSRTRTQGAPAAEGAPEVPTNVQSPNSSGAASLEDVLKRVEGAR